MKRNRLLILSYGLFTILTGNLVFPKIDQFLKVDGCLDKGGSWNYDTNECIFSKEITESSILDSLNGYNELDDKQNRTTYPVSEFNKDLGYKNIERPEKSSIINPTIDTTQLFKIWTIDPDGPHADFWFKPTDFFVVDYDGNGAMPYILNRDSLTIFYNDFIQKGKIVSVSKDTLKIIWNDAESPTEYLEWKN